MDNLEFIYGGPDDIKCVLRNPLKIEFPEQVDDTKPIIPIVTDCKPDITNYDTTTTYSIQRLGQKMIIVKDTEDLVENNEIHANEQQETDSKEYLTNTINNKYLQPSKDTIEIIAEQEINYTELVNALNGTLRKNIDQFKEKQPINRIVDFKKELLLATSNKINTLHKEDIIIKLNRYQCDACDKFLPSKEAFRKHAEKSHRCKMCNKWFADLKNLTIHSDTHAEGRTISCEICAKRFDTIGKLNIHFNMAHIMFDCSICQKRLKGKSSYQKHIKNHLVKRTFTCQVCYEIFRSRNAYRKHTVKHSGKTYECYLCSKIFGTYDALRSHFIIHSRQKLFRCTICDKAFLRPSYLIIHNRVHTKEKLFECEICDKKYSTRYGVTKHTKAVHKI